jgi:hypothetical protein
VYSMRGIEEDSSGTSVTRIQKKENVVTRRRRGGTEEEESSFGALSLHQSSRRYRESRGRSWLSRSCAIARAASRPRSGRSRRRCARREALRVKIYPVGDPRAGVRKESTLFTGPEDGLGMVL